MLGFGCAVPAIYATRTIANRRDRLLTALLIPFMSCSARLPVYVVFALAFFGAQAGTVIWVLYALGVVVANHSKELSRLKNRPRIYFAKASHAAGILEGIEYYNFMDKIVIPNDRIE